MWFLYAAPVVFIALRSIYRLYFHPLRGFPGPRLAAVTHLYELYYDIVQTGLYIHEIEKMHQRYGPVVRISPGELHINDPHYYDEVYASGRRKRDKGWKHVRSFSAKSSMIATVNHDHHRFRRGIVQEFFSKMAIAKLGSLVDEKVSRLSERLVEAHAGDKVVHMEDAFAALTTDVITYICFGESFGFLEDENYSNEVRQVVSHSAGLVHVIRVFPFVHALFRDLPGWFLCWLKPQFAGVIRLRAGITERSIDALRKSQKKDKRSLGTRERKTMLDSLSDETLPAEERTLRRLEDEAGLALAAGTETSSRVLSVALFYIYRDKYRLSKIRDELKTVMATPTSPVTWTQLEQLPYLTAVIHESLRLSFGVSLRSARVAPTEVLKYGEFLIPPGTPISMTPYSIQRNPTVFPDPDTFRPERWIEAAVRGQHLTKFLVSFSKGSRGCIGINLAYLELYTTLAWLFRRFDMELYQTTEDNVRAYRDLGISYPKEGDFMVKVKITNVLKE